MSDIEYPTANELRAMVDLAPVDGGDDVRIAITKAMLVDAPNMRRYIEERVQLLMDTSNGGATNE